MSGVILGRIPYGPMIAFELAGEVIAEFAAGADQEQEPGPQPAPENCPAPQAECPADAPASRELSLRIRDVRDYPSEVIDQVVHQGKTVAVYAAHPGDNIGRESLPAETARPVMVMLPIHEYRRLVGLERALADVASITQRSAEVIYERAARAVDGAAA